MDESLTCLSTLLVWGSHVQLEALLFLTLPARQRITIHTRSIQNKCPEHLCAFRLQPVLWALHTHIRKLQVQ